MSFYIGIAKLHADIPHETLTFLEDSKNALSPRMFNIFLCFSVFHIHTELISSQYMPGGRISQSREKGLRPRRKKHVPQLFPPRRPSVPVNTDVYGHREKTPSTSVFTGAVRSKEKLFSRYDSTIRIHSCTAHFRKRAWGNSIKDLRRSIFPPACPSSCRRPPCFFRHSMDFPETGAIKNPAS